MHAKCVTGYEDDDDDDAQWLVARANGRFMGALLERGETPRNKV